MNCGLALTRLAYFAVGMIDELPPAGSMEELIAKSQLPVAKTVKARKEAGTSTQRTTRGVVQIEEQDKEVETLFKRIQKLGRVKKH